MKYSEFVDYVKENILNYLPEDEYANAKVTVYPVKKNNGLVLDALMVNKENSQITPTLYLNNFYQNMTENDHTLEATMWEIVKVRLEYDQGLKLPMPVENLQSYEAIKDFIIMKIVNKDYNKDRLKEIAHTDIGDLSITYSVLLGKGKDSVGSVPITNELMDSYGVTVEDLYEVAMQNSPQLEPANLKTMVEILKEMILGSGGSFGELEEEMFQEDNRIPMYVLTNEDKLNGAATLFYPGMMEKIGNQLESDFVVLPSSIHEVIIVPVDLTMDKEYLINMVKEVNESQVAPDEVLANTAFAYNREEKLFYNMENEKTNVLDMGKTDMEYLEKVAAKVYEQTAEHPTVEGKEMYLKQLKEAVNEKGYTQTLAELKDQQREVQKERNERDCERSTEQER